jgi:uncharacterized Rmd1/YagE family protein
MSGQIIAVDAYGFAATFDLKELAPIFGIAKGAELRVKERLVAQLGPQKWVLAYDFGALVFVGVPTAEQVQLVSQVEKRIPREQHPPLTESFTIEIKEEGPPEVRFDRVLSAHLTLEVVDIVALVLAQSVAMDYYAKDVGEIEREIDRLIDVLRTEGQLPGRMKGLQRFIGVCIATRNDVLSTLALFDKPDATWESETLDKLWDALYRMLELDDRYRALDAKLRLFQDNMVVLADLARGRHAFFLEVTIVVLIFLEGLIMIWQVLAGRH